MVGTAQSFPKQLGRTSLLLVCCGWSSSFAEYQGCSPGEPCWQHGASSQALPPGLALSKPPCLRNIAACDLFFQVAHDPQVFTKHSSVSRRIHGFGWFHLLPWPGPCVTVPAQPLAARLSAPCFPKPELILGCRDLTPSVWL